MTIKTLLFLIPGARCLPPEEKALSGILELPLASTDKPRGLAQLPLGFLTSLSQCASLHDSIQFRSIHPGFDSHSPVLAHSAHCP